MFNYLMCLGRAAFTSFIAASYVPSYKHKSFLVQSCGGHFLLTTLSAFHCTEHTL